MHSVEHHDFDLVSPDGKITAITDREQSGACWKVEITQVAPDFVGFSIPPSLVTFNAKSTLAQLGLHTRLEEIVLERAHRRAECRLRVEAYGKWGEQMLALITEGAYVGKLFAADDRRRVRDPDYLARMFGRADRQGRPLLLLGGLQGTDHLILEKIEGRTVAFIALLGGVVVFAETLGGFLPTVAKGLQDRTLSLRKLLQLHQEWHPRGERTVQPGEMLLVRTLPLHVRTVFAQVVSSMLPPGVNHTSAAVLQPDTQASGDIYELFGASSKELRDIPLEFYTLEPHREYVFFADRDQLQATLEDPQALFQAFATAPAPLHHLAAVFIVKGEQMQRLSPEEWVSCEPRMNDFPGVSSPSRQAAAVEKYIQQQPAYPFLKRIEEGEITSEGVLFSRYFPSPLLKQMLLNDTIHRYLKRIYFAFPSLTYGDFFSHEDRSLLLDLAKFGIPTYWVDGTSQAILQYLPKPGKDSGMFVPLAQVETFLKSTLLGIYGSNLMTLDLEHELTALLSGVLELRRHVNHPLLNTDTPLALVTGGGPGSMSLGNKVAKNLGILSCANIMDFRGKKENILNEQKQNPYIEAKMTYRLDKLVERQSEFNLDLPIFLVGGIGTDFEYALEEVRRKVGATQLTPVLLFGAPAYWSSKISSRFRCNAATGTIAGSEWVSNCFFCVQNGVEALHVYRRFFSGTLKLGPEGVVYDRGFAMAEDLAHSS